jgi:uncharacterized glyoxalase superfamily protein PhnB
MARLAAKKAALTRKRRAAARKAVTTRKRRAAGRKAAKTRKQGVAASTTPSVIPMISYEDGIAALAWLDKAVGFRETTRLTGPDDTLWHGEMEAGDGLIMLASPTRDYQSPKHHREICDQARRWSAVPWIIDGVLVYVEDLDAHFKRAQAAGATILSDIEEGPPGRRYRAEDLEGHRWFFFEKG